MPLPGVGEKAFDVFPLVEVKPTFELPCLPTQASGIGEGLRAGPRSAPLDSVKQLRIKPPAADQVVSAILGRPHYQIAFGESVEGSTDYARGERGTIAPKDDHTLRAGGERASECRRHAVTQIASFLDRAAETGRKHYAAARCSCGRCFAEENPQSGVPQSLCQQGGRIAHSRAMERAGQHGGQVSPQARLDLSGDGSPGKQDCAIVSRSAKRDGSCRNF